MHLLLLVLLLLFLQGASNNSSPDLLAKFALASNINQAAVRSPKWFGSAALQDELDDAAEQAAGGHEHSRLYMHTRLPPRYASPASFRCLKAYSCNGFACSFARMCRLCQCHGQA